MTKIRQDDIIPRCQYSLDCKNIPLVYRPFCRNHYNLLKTVIHLSGNEPMYDPDKYNKYKGIKESHNCFSYALDDINLPKKCTKKACDVSYPQPGFYSGYPKWNDIKGKRCPDLLARLIGDIPEIKITTFEKKPIKGMRKIAIVVDKNKDYHFYRQDSNGYWSHKPGGGNVTNLDATDRPIFNPELASRYYPKHGLNYDFFCSFLMIPIKKHYKVSRIPKYHHNITKKTSKRI